MEARGAIAVRRSGPFGLSAYRNRLVWRGLTIAAIVAALSLATALVGRAAQPRIVLIGDSVTAGWGASDPGHAWPSLLGVPVFAIAAPGSPSATFVHGTWRAETVVIELGINDFAHGIAPAIYGEHMHEILTHVSADRVVLLVPYEVGRHGLAPWSAYADQLLALAHSDPRVVLVDLRPAFGAPSTALLDPDLVHPNDRGHALIARLVAEAVSR